jgi:hypothetical protein
MVAHTDCGAMDSAGGPFRNKGFLPADGRFNGRKNSSPAIQHLAQTEKKC